ncbi:hypothetical protein CHS0354_042395 [Potamilus streckersoni]|uniref:Uncharacterized protein n=1 Tax=Potamilus streckersoni TaxID=2493646 RepID=A0AAE0SUY8_9BIVA|nr:hypothetical protein CHS0354_042395 [Potamilus streckersoni]
MRYSPGKVLILMIFVIFLVQTFYNKFFNYSVSYTVPDNVWRRIALQHKDLYGEPPIQNESTDLRIIVMVYNRADSLSRLIKSLNEALYFGERVVLDIWIDRSKDGQIDENTYRIASEFQFKHGVKIVHNHTFHVGIYGQWLNTWTPKSNSSEIAVILEDDLTVSPYFYRWLKIVHKKYDKLVEVNGYSLQGISIKHGIGSEGLLEAPFEDVVFLYPVIGTWGFSPNRRNWVKFRDWLEVILHDDKFQPLVPNILPTSWYQAFIQTGKTEGMWSMWHIYHAWKTREFTLYPNFAGHLGLTVNWKESGLHYGPGLSQESKNPSNNLVTTWRAGYENLPENPIRLDVYGNIDAVEDP